MGCGLAIAIGCGGSTTGSELLSGHGGATSAVGGAAGTSNAGGSSAGGAAGTGMIGGAGGADTAGAAGASAGTGGSGTAGTGGSSAAGGTGAGNGGTSAGTGGTATAGSGGGTGTAGTTGAGGSGPKDCAMLLADLKTYLAIAQTCSLSVSSVQCHDTVPGLCCPHIVTNKDSSETQSYLAALANFKAKCSGAPCPGTPCKTTMPGMCKEASPGSVAGACPDVQIVP